MHQPIDQRVGGSRAHLVGTISRNFATDWGRFEPAQGRDVDRQVLDLLRAETTAAADRRGRMLGALEKLVADNG